MLNIGVIGFGSRANGVVGMMLDRAGDEVRLAAVCDKDIKTARERYLDPRGLTDVNYYTDAAEMLEKEELDGVFIGTNCSTHAGLAVLAAGYGVPIFLEKPVATTFEDVEKLKGILDFNDSIVVSFPLRTSGITTFVKKLIDSGVIGEIAHVQACNNVPYGIGYYQKWYRDDSITGGLFLQKATHDLDYVNYIIGNHKPVRVCAMTSKQVFRGNKPAGLKCVDCDEKTTCPESTYLKKLQPTGHTVGEYCCFATDTGNEDSGSAVIEYDNGMHVVYSQDFIVRNDAGKRGARFIGYKGTLEFDFITGIVTVYHHHDKTVDSYNLSEGSEGHFGGDYTLIDNFIDVMKGCDRSHSPLSEGILSAELCLSAKKSSQEHIFVDINR